MSELDAKRAAIAAVVARQQGLDPRDHATIDRRVEAVIGAFDPDVPEPSDADGMELHRLLRGYRELRTDRNNARLAEKGEVFAPEDDA